MPDLSSINSLKISGDAISLPEKLENLPTTPGVYQFKGAEGKVLYVGKAVNLRNRVRQYFAGRGRPSAGRVRSHQGDPRIAAMVSKVTDVELIMTDSEVEALILEATLIKKLKPRYNVDLKDDKSYPYIVITNEPYPRVFVTRHVVRDGSKYFGPYVDVKNMRASLKMIREIFKVRSCNYFIDEEVIRKRKIRVCLDYHIKKCEGPCEGLVSREHYNAMFTEVAQVLKGKTSGLIADLGERMEAAAAGLRFEEAAELRDKIEQLSVYSDRQKVIDAEKIDRDLFTVAMEGDDACGVIFKVRDGKIVGRQHVYMTGVRGRKEEEVTEQFLERYYLDAEDIPREVFLAVELESSQAVAEWLARKGGKQVELVTPKIGEKAKLMGMCRANARFLLDALKLQRVKWKEAVPPGISALQRDLRLEHPPRRIECFDISNIQGSDSVASMVLFEDGRPKKSGYRKFKIGTVSGPDDFASMREVIGRRYTRLLEEQSALPDLIVVDGGKGQLSSAIEVLRQLGLHGKSETAVAVQGTGGRYIPIIGLAKRLEEVFTPGSGEPHTIAKSSPGLKLLQRIRDEAHRFAITYHRTLRTKRMLQTELDLISGVGKKRARELLEAFGSVQGVKFATAEQLSEVVGESVALRIKEYFEIPQTS